MKTHVKKPQKIFCHFRITTYDKGFPSAVFFYLIETGFDTDTRLVLCRICLCQYFIVFKRSIILLKYAHNAQRHLTEHYILASVINKTIENHIQSLWPLNGKVWHLFVSLSVFFIFLSSFIKLKPNFTSLIWNSECFHAVSFPCSQNVS